MKTLTTYRIIKSGRQEFLEYLKIYKWFFFFKIEKWEKIPYPCSKGLPQFISNLQLEYRSNVKKFVLKYPDINVYFKTEYLERKKKFK